MTQIDVTDAVPGPWPFATSHMPRRPAAARLRDLSEITNDVTETLNRFLDLQGQAAARPTPNETPDRTFVIECEVEFDGRTGRFTFEVTAENEDQATDRAIEMLDRARVTDTRAKADRARSIRP